MGRKRASNDIDFVEPPKYDVLPSWKAKRRPPEPWPLPDFEPLHINNPLRNGRAKLPNDVIAIANNCIALWHNKDVSVEPLIGSLTIGRVPPAHGIVLLPLAKGLGRYALAISILLRKAPTYLPILNSLYFGL